MELEPCKKLSSFSYSQSSLFFQALLMAAFKAMTEKSCAQLSQLIVLRASKVTLLAVEKPPNAFRVLTAVWPVVVLLLNASKTSKVTFYADVRAQHALKASKATWPAEEKLPVAFRASMAISLVVVGIEDRFPQFPEFKPLAQV